MKIFFRVNVLVFFLGIFGRQLLAQTQPAPRSEAQKGLLDLRCTDLSSQFAPLNGKWKFYWQKLLVPGDTFPDQQQYIQYPQLWKDARGAQSSLVSQGYGTYCLTILLPPKHGALAMEVPPAFCSYSLFVNNRLVAENGKPAANAAAAVPFWSTEFVSLRDVGDTLRVVMQVANYWHAKGGISRAITLGNHKQLVLRYRVNNALGLILAGCLFMGGLFFWGLSVFGRNDKIIFYFSVFCMVTSYRMIGTEPYVLHSLFPRLSWFFTVRLEYLTLVLGVALFSQYTRMLYPKDTQQVLMKAVIYFCLAYASIILFAPALVFTSLLNYFLVVMFLYIAYALYIYVQAVINKRNGAVYALLSSGIMLMVYLVVNLQYFNLIPETPLLIFVGYVAFFFLQSLVMSHRFSDILQQAAAEAQQGLKAKTEFLSTMSHEIRTPLNSVIGMAHLLNRSEPRKDQQEQLNVLLFSANNLLSIVNNILDYNKIEAGKISIEQIAMDLPSMARNVLAGLQNLADDKLVILKLDLDPRLTHKVIGDPTRTSQVLNNLVHNAIKFTREGAVTLCIQAEKIEADRVTVRVSVADTGIGIAPEKQQLIFERFTQADSSTSRSFGGTGLGLSISKKILEMQGCRLQLKSQPGIGSEFYFTQTFALSAEAASVEAPASEYKEEEATSLEGVSILLVEDNPLNVMVAKAFLERCGAVIDVAENGEESIRMFDAAKYRLVLMDLDMPVMDGYEATRWLRNKGETLPVIALTASLPKEVESEVYAAGLTDIIVKPFNPDDLFRVVLQHLKAMAA